MHYLFKHLITPMLLSAGALLCGYTVNVNAATFVNSGHAAGPQCNTVGVNDSGQVVGNCASSNPSANGNPWYSSTLAGPQQVLLPLVTGQPCIAKAIANNGWMVGVCSSTGNLVSAVFWNAAAVGSAPVKMAPLPGSLIFPLLRPADKQTTPSAQNQNGMVLAQSISASEAATVVVYNAGNGTPQRVSGWGDNCTGVDLTETLTNGWPSILMNCPGANGTPVITVASWSGGGYALTTPPTSELASFCVAADMNDQGRIVGTCVFPGSTADTQQTAFWSTSTSAPSLLTMPLNAQNKGVAVNASGHVLAYGNDPSGIDKSLYWPDPTNSFTVQPVQSITECVQLRAAGFGDNDTVALNCLDSNQNLSTAYWTPGGATVRLSQLPNGLLSVLSGISPNGWFVFGGAMDAAKTHNAVAADVH
jgi:hypothetical protein